MGCGWNGLRQPGLDHRGQGLGRGRLPQAQGRVLQEAFLQPGEE